MESFSGILKHLRNREHLTQLELADKLGIAKSTVSMYENGNREPDFDTLVCIADFFKNNRTFLLLKPRNTTNCAGNLRKWRFKNTFWYYKRLHTRRYEKSNIND